MCRGAIGDSRLIPAGSRRSYILDLGHDPAHRTADQRLVHAQHPHHPLRPTHARRERHQRCGALLSHRRLVVGRRDEGGLRHDAARHRQRAVSSPRPTHPRPRLSLCPPCGTRRTGVRPVRTLPAVGTSVSTRPAGPRRASVQAPRRRPAVPGASRARTCALGILCLQDLAALGLPTRRPVRPCRRRACRDRPGGLSSPGLRSPPPSPLRR